jgi:hypothetical protein
MAAALVCCLLKSGLIYEFTAHRQLMSCKRLGAKTL